jgi:NCS2 family nucleobase:cation symporter-2
MAVILVPSHLVASTPQIIQYLLGSPITIAAISAIILNLVMGERPEKSPSSAAETVTTKKQTSKLAESKS